MVRLRRPGGLADVSSRYLVVALCGERKSSQDKDYPPRDKKKTKTTTTEEL